MEWNINVRKRASRIVLGIFTCFLMLLFTANIAAAISNGTMIQNSQAASVLHSEDKGGINDLTVMVYDSNHNGVNRTDIMRIVLEFLGVLPEQCIPLGIAAFDQSPEPGAKDVPVATNISISFWRPLGIVELEIMPKVEISNITEEIVGIANGKYTFHPAEPLQPETTYRVTITYGQKDAPEGFCPTSNISWQFTTGSTVNGYSRISIANVTTTPNSSITRMIIVENISNLAAGTIELTYDPDSVNVVSVSAGDLGGVTTNIDNTTGKVTMSAFSTTPKSGHVTFANVLLKAVGSVNATSPLTLSVSSLADQNGVAIPNTVQNGTFIVTSVIKGDVNGDGQVTIVDALFVAQYTIGMKTLSASQLAAGDVNSDGQVSIVDALFIAQYTVGLRQL